MFRLRHKTKKITIPVLYGNLLVDRCAIITGGTRGIGFAIADVFLKNGAIVIITGRNFENIKSAKEKLLEHNSNCKEKIYGIAFDCSHDREIDSKFQEIQTLIGAEKKIDILVNNAGIMNGCDYFDTSSEDFDSVINTNLRFPFFLSKVFSSYLIKNNIRGNILNIASSSSLRPADSPYGISKWGIRGFTLGLAEKCIPYGIIVNGLAPGPTATDMLNASSSIDLPEKPFGRYIMPEEIANLAVALVSDIGKCIVGDIIYATGGSALLVRDIKNKE